GPRPPLAQLGGLLDAAVQELLAHLAEEIAGVDLEPAELDELVDDDGDRDDATESDGVHHRPTGQIHPCEIPEHPSEDNAPGSLVPERLDRVQARGLGGGVDPEEQADGGGEAE